METEKGRWERRQVLRGAHVVGGSNDRPERRNFLFHQNRPYHQSSRQADLIADKVTEGRWSEVTVRYSGITAKKLQL